MTRARTILNILIIKLIFNIKIIKIKLFMIKNDLNKKYSLN
jgi:hypothetical protein